MAKAYSMDLRQKVAAFVASGHSRRETATRFCVSPSFVINLMTALRERGELSPKPQGGRRHAKLEPHRAFLLQRVAEKDDITMPELATDLLAQSGVKVDPSSLSHWLIRNGLSFKKKAFRPASATVPTCARGAKNGRLSASPECGPNRIASCSSTRLEPTRR